MLSCDCKLTIAHIVNFCNTFLQILRGGGDKLKAEWTGELVGKMHTHEVTLEELATECGWVKGYVSMILNGQRSPAGAKEKLYEAFEAIVERKKEGE